MNTLTDFFSRTPSTDLTTCDQEQVHLLGTIQQEGAMLVVRQDTQLLVAISDNFMELLGCESIQVQDESLNQIHGELSTLLRRLDPAQEGAHQVLDLSISHDGKLYETIVHGHLGNWIIELIPGSGDLDSLKLRKQMRVMSSACGRILSSETVDDALQFACDAVREITSFARVQIFQFLPDWSGKVTADSRAVHMSSFVGLHFPADDIPQQARALMKLVPYRGVFSVHDQTVKLRQNPQFGEQSVDLTYTLIRSCSEMHTAYLRNMGVEATFSVSLMQGDSLWGFISCHHDHAAALPFDSWSLLRELGTALMSRVGYEANRNASEKILQLRKIEGEFASLIRKNRDVSNVVGKFGPSLMNFMNADGFAFQFNDEIYLFGETPPKEFISKTIDWVSNNTDFSFQFNTTALHKKWPEAKNHIDKACGILIQPVATERVCQLIWFRKPISETVTWAGVPTDKSTSTYHSDTANLLPRTSFAKWIAEHNDFSAAWTDSELDIAKDILREILDILASVLLLSEENTRLALSEENTKLKTFAATAAAHDIKGPLRRIELALQLMEEDTFDPEAIKQFHGIASKSARVLKNVSGGILDFMSLPDDARAFSSVNLSDIFTDVESVISSDIENESVGITIDAEHSVCGESSLLTSLFLNLTGNSIKYSKPDQIAKIHLQSQLVDEQWVEISVTDNGIGIPAEYIHKVFLPSERLNLKDDVEGAGMGLSICSHIVNMHKGSICVDESYKDGARIIVRIPRSA